MWRVAKEGSLQQKMRFSITKELSHISLLIKTTGSMYFSIFLLFFP